MVRFAPKNWVHAVVLRLLPPGTTPKRHFNNKTCKLGPRIKNVRMFLLGDNTLIQPSSFFFLFSFN